LVPPEAVLLFLYSILKEIKMTDIEATRRMPGPVLSSFVS